MKRIAAVLFSCTVLFVFGAGLLQANAPVSIPWCDTACVVNGQCTYSNIFCSCVNERGQTIGMYCFDWCEVGCTDI